MLRYNLGSVSGPSEQEAHPQELSVPDDRECHPWIILISGTTSSGKTTLSRALQHRLTRPTRLFLHIEADRFVPHLPEDVGPGQSSSVSRALHRAITAFAEQGFDLIVDGILPYGRPDDIADALSVFRRYRLCHVGVHCSLDVLEERERLRPQREPGWARHQFQDLHAGASYDVEVDTTAVSPEDNSERVARYLMDRDAGIAAFNPSG